jgi:hypothetical protein
MFLLVCRQNKGPGVVVGGRQLDVDLALAQESARQLAANKVCVAAVRPFVVILRVVAEPQATNSAHGCDALSSLVFTYHE